MEYFKFQFESMPAETGPGDRYALGIRLGFEDGQMLSAFIPVNDCGKIHFKQLIEQYDQNALDQ